MTVPATMWKRSKWASLPLVLSLLSASALVSLARPALAVEAGGTRLPNIRQVSITPVHWQGSFPDSPRFLQCKKHLEAGFSGIVRNSKRFVFSNDVLTADLWSSAEGRRQLAEDYEIDAFVNLTVSGQGDLMRWTVRLLHPSMRNYLSETEAMPFSWMLSATDAEIDLRMQNLVFRMLNRFPVDVFVTSIQGRYLTLSSGLEQNVFEGDDLSFYQTNVRTQHPADGSWLSFDQKLLGKAKIIESKSHSSIALITALSYTDSIRVGDGAKVASIATRRPFQQKPAEDQYYVPVTPDSPLVEARPLSSAPAGAPARQEEPVAPVEAENPRVAAIDMEPVAPAKREPAAQPAYEPTPAPNPTVEGDSQNDFLPIAFKEVEVQGQSESWSVSGSAHAANTFPLWLLNRVELAAHQDINPEVQGTVRAHLRFGSTQNGSYFGFGIGFEPLYQITLQTPMIPSLDRLLVGALVSFESMAITGEKLGGWDTLSLSPSLHLQGAYHAVSMVQTFDYDILTRLTPLDMGQVGISGSKRKISDSMSLEFEASVIRQAKPQDWEWGAMFGYQTGSFSLSKGSVDSSNLRLGIAGRMRL